MWKYFFLIITYLEASSDDTYMEIMLGTSLILDFLVAILYARLVLFFISPFLLGFFWVLLSTCYQLFAVNLILS